MPDYQLSADIIGGKELAERLNASSPFMLKAVADALNQSANDITQLAKANAPHEHGHLRDSIHAEYAQPSGINMKAKVGTNLIYARAQEFGTEGMEIHSRSKLGNAFTYTGNIKPKFYMKRAKEEGKPMMTTHLENALRRITRYLANT